MRALLASVLVLFAAPTYAQAPGATGPGSSQAPGAKDPAAPAPSPPGAQPAQPAPSAPSAPSAPTGPMLIELEVDVLPAPCRTIAKEANAKALGRALGARLSLASCLTDAAMAGLSLIDGQESVLAVEAAIAPSRALLDEVIEHADPETKLLAQRGIALLYASVASRMLATVPGPVDRRDASQALRKVRLANVETMITPWREAETGAHAEIVKLAAAYPRLARDSAYAEAIKTSRARIATRP